MALNFNVLAQVPSVAERFMAGRQAAQEEQQRNMLLQQRQMEFSQAQEDRQKAQAREAQFQQLADLMAQNGLDPDDPKVLGEFGSRALKTGNTQLFTAITAMADRAAKRREAIAGKAATQAEMARIFGPQAGAAPAAAAAGMGAPPITSTLIDEGAPRPEARVPLSIEGGAQAMPVQPQAQVTTRDISTSNALAPAAPAAAPQNRLVTREQVQRGLMSANPAVRDAAIAMSRLLPKEPGAEGLPPADVRAMQMLGFPLTREGFTQYKAAGQKPEGQQQDIALMQRLGLPITPEGFAQLQQMRRPPEKPDFTPAQLQKRRDTLGKEYKSAVAALQTTQDVLDSATAVKESEGLSRATGFTGTMLPSFPGGEAAFAETRLKNLKGKVTALGKAAAASTGAIGSIANQEWKILADQIAAIDEIKGAGPLLEQIDLLEAQARGAMERIRGAYEKQFGEDFERFPQFAALPEPKSSLKRAPQSQGPASAAPAAGGALTPAEQAELEQLRQRFGRQPQGGQ